MMKHNIQQSYPHITIQTKTKNDTPYAYIVTPDEGYQMYNTDSEYYTQDPETGEQIPTIKYIDSADLPLTYDFNNFPYVAVLKEVK